MRPPGLGITRLILPSRHEMRQWVQPFSGMRISQDECRSGGLAQRLGIGRDTIRRWIRAGWVTSSRDVEGHHVILADSSELARLRELHALPRTWATEGRLSELAKPKPRPER